MTGFWYQHTANYPAFFSQSSSANERAESDMIQAGFDKFATPTGYANHMVKVKDNEDGYDFSAAILTTAGVMGGLTGLTSTGTINFTGATMYCGAMNLGGSIASNSGNAVAAGDLVNLGTAQSLLSMGGTPGNIYLWSIGSGTQARISLERVERRARQLTFA